MRGPGPSGPGARITDALRGRIISTALLLGNGLVYILRAGLVWKFRRRLGYFPNVCAPRSKNEKFLWRKIFDRNPLYGRMSDKLAVRGLVAERCPDLECTEIVWTGTKAADIPSEYFSPSFVIKTNNGSSRNIFPEHAYLGLAGQRARLQSWIVKPYGVRDGQWNYATIPSSIFVERRITPTPGEEFLDISCHVLLGECPIVTVDKNVKQDDERIAVYDATGRRLKASFRARHRAQQHMELPADFHPPATLPRAIAYARQLARDCDYVRVDFMSAGQRLHFCECTIFPMGGYSLIADGADDAITALWDLRHAWFLRAPQRGWRRLYASMLRADLDRKATVA